MCKKQDIKELIDKIKVIPEEKVDMEKIKELAKKVIAKKYNNV